MRRKVQGRFSGAQLATRLRSSAGVGGWRSFVLGALVATIVILLIVPVLSPDRTGELEEGPLVILSGRDVSAGKQRNVLIERWNQAYPKNPARVIELSGLADDERNEMVKNAQAGKGDVDIYNLDVTLLAEFAENGYIRRLDEVDETGFLPEPLATCRYDGELYALPFNSDAGLLYFRSDLVPLPPSNWDAMAGALMRLPSGQRDPRLEASYTGQLRDYEGLTVNVLEIYYSLDGEILDESGDVVIDPGKLQRAVDLLTPKPPGSPQVVLPASRQFNETESTQAFREGKVLYMRNWPVAYSTLESREERGSAHRRVDFDVAQLPGGSSVLGGQNLAIASTSSRPRAAQELIEFLTSPPSQQTLFQDGGLAATREAMYADPAIVEKYPYAQELLKAIRNSKSRPESRCYARFSEVLRDAVAEALRTGEALPNDFAEDLTRALQCRPLR